MTTTAAGFTITNPMHIALLLRPQMEGKMAGAGLRTDGGAVGRAGEGGGKYRIKEPQDLLRATVRQIDGVLSASN